MPHPESERRRQFLKFNLEQNAAAYSEETQADMASELKFLDSMYEMEEKRKAETQPDKLAKKVESPEPSESEIPIDSGKFNS